MNKNILASIVIASVFVIGAGTLAPTASALTANELQVQIRELLAKIADLTNQLNILQGSDSTTVTIPGSEIISDAFMPSPHRVCGILNRKVSSGAQGDDVQSLQEFLHDEGYFSANATGYFGPMTAQAVAKWQVSQGLPGVGSVGPMTFAQIKKRCQGGVNSGLLRATPQSGIAPLAVSFWYVLGGATVSESDYFIEFGDGATSSVMIGCGSMGNSAACSRSLTASHTYAADGTYTAALYKTSRGGCTPEAEAQGCLGAPASQKVVGRVQIRVGTPSVNPNPENDPNCKAWFDGCNTCSRQAPGAPAMCTLRGCTAESMVAPYCTMWFDNNSGNKPPVISSFSGPTTLALNSIGTWSIQASDPEGQSLTYSIRWGDEPVNMAWSSEFDASRVFVQTTTFTHAYASAGIYTITIVVRDAAGREARTSTTVSVGGTSVACTADAMQCPNGSYVGRTGPNCQFVCSN